MNVDINNILLNEYLKELNNKISNLNDSYNSLIECISDTLLINDQIVCKKNLSEMNNYNLEVESQLVMISKK